MSKADRGAVASGSDGSFQWNFLAECVLADVSWLGCVLRGSILAPLTCAWLRDWLVLEPLSFQMFSGNGRGVIVMFVLVVKSRN